MGNKSTHLDNFEAIYLLALIIFGKIGNSLAGFIYTKKELFKTSTGFYFFCSVIIDTLALYFGLLKFFLEAVWNIDILLDSEFNCKFLRFTVYFSVQLSAWLLVTVSLDRALIFFSYFF